MYLRTIIREADELLPNEPQREAGGTLVIHVDDRSTDFLKLIYSGKGYQTITGRIDEKQLFDEVRKHSRIFMLGHGGPRGLFGPGYMIGEKFGPELSKKTGLYIWCHAVEYAHQFKLTGLVSGMFISEVSEAAWEGIKATQEEVNASNYAFSASVRQYLDKGTSPHEIKNCYNSATCRVTQYNNERLYVMEKGTITDSFGKKHSDEVSAKPGSPRYQPPWKKHEPLRGAHGELDEPPEEFKKDYRWDEDLPSSS